MGLVIIPARTGKGLKQRFSSRQRKKILDNDSLNFPDFPFIDSLDEIWLLVALGILALIFSFVGVPLILIAIDVAWLLAVLIGALFSFGIRKKPITIRAYSENKTHFWQKKGFMNALRFKKSVAESLACGVIPKA